MSYRIDFEFGGGTTYFVTVQGDLPPMFRDQFTELKRIKVVQLRTEPTEKVIGEYSVSKGT